MPRYLTVNTKELQRVSMLVIRETAGVWEPEWEPLRETCIASLFTRVTRGALEHALRGWSWPLISALGLPPEGALRKLPSSAKTCRDAGTCGVYQAEHCHPLAKKMPVCFHPKDLPYPAQEVIRLWRENSYVVVTIEEPNG